MKNDATPECAITTVSTGEDSTRLSEHGDRSIVQRQFTTSGANVYEALGPWSRRDARIVGDGGEVFFEQRDVEAPESWSDRAVTIVASKYFRGHLGDDDREDSVRDLVARIVETISDWALEDGYLADATERDVFRDELAFLVISQSLAFNTPVWLNVGVDDRPQCSACYVSSVEDHLASIMEFAKTEAKIFQRGGGSGANLSKLRSSGERLSNGGTASGPVSFMRGLDAFAGVIKSGGRMRRAAKMIVLDVDHPDILRFIESKTTEERKVGVLVEAGYSGGIDGEAYGSVFFQNENHSVRVTDGFMLAVENDEPWRLTARTTGDVVEEVPAREIFRRIVEAAHACGDPGLQFDTTINRWHTSPVAGRINASNPCSEYMYLDDSACNLASLNLRKFQQPNGTLDTAAFSAAIDVAILAQEVIVDRASYPTDRIGERSRRFRPLGLGYANLGAFLMARGLPYDSDEARAVAATVTALLTGRAYGRSAEIAKLKGPFDGYDVNRASFLDVIERHRAAYDRIRDVEAAFDETSGVSLAESESARGAWDSALVRGRRYGFRNGQVTVLAPTGTISFVMDCSTMGIEPDIVLVKRKALVGGGVLDLENETVPVALQRLGYQSSEIVEIVEHVKSVGTAVGARELKCEHVPVFDCALPDANSRSISVNGHVRMMASVQPFVSGAISKTTNLPRSATVEDVERVYLEAWRWGLKSITVYRDGSKEFQPLEAKRGTNGNGETELRKASDVGRLAELSPGEIISTRVKLPDEARTVRHKFDLGGIEGYIHVGLYDDGRVGELFVRMAKEGSTISGLVDALATSVSIGLQYGVPLSVFVSKFSHWRFEPSGFSQDRRIGHASSIIDYVFRWIDVRFPGGRDVRPGEIEARPPDRSKSISDAPFCPICQSQMRRNGTCHVCASCGTTTGCS